MLDPSRVRNVQDAVEKVLRDVLVARHGPGFLRLRRRDPPRGLPQQADAINCGLFVVLFSIHLVFRRDRPALPPPDVAAAAAKAPPLDDDLFIDPKTGAPQHRRKSRRLEESASSKATAALETVQVCYFTHGAEDLFKYRLMLLAWILHSQTSQLPRTEPVLLHFIRAPVAVPADSLGCDTKVSKRRLLLALLRDDASAADRAELLRGGMRLLQRFHKQGAMTFLPPSWFEQARQGNYEAAHNIMEAEFTAELEQVCAPVLLPNGQGCLLARISLKLELQTVYLHGSHALAHDDAVIPPILAALQLTFDKEFRVRHVLATQAPDDRSQEVVTLLSAMQACHRWDACHDSEELVPGGGGGRGGGGGPNLSSGERFFAARLGLIRWFLRHTSWVG
jgi:hypothetical protein